MLAFAAEIQAILVTFDGDLYGHAKRLGESGNHICLIGGEILDSCKEQTKAAFGVAFVLLVADG